MTSEIADLIDHRALTIIDKARRYDALEKAKAELPAKKVVPKSKAKALEVGRLGFLATRKTHPRQRLARAADCVRPKRVFRGII
jgi:hypothetical protein